MPEYQEVIRVHTLEGESRSEIHFYWQSRLIHVIAWMYCHLWEPMTWRIYRFFEPHLERRHQKKCDSGCVTGYNSRTGERVPMCGYVPITNRQDLRCADLHNRKRVPGRIIPVAAITNVDTPGGIGRKP